MDFLNKLHEYAKEMYIASREAQSCDEDEEASERMD